MTAKIASDPRITHNEIHVRFERQCCGDQRGKGMIVLQGRAGSDEEITAATNDAIASTDLSVSTSLGVAADQAAQPANALPVPWAGRTAAEQPLVPLCEGLTVVTAIASSGDYESIKTIESVGPSEVHLKYSSESSPPWWSIFKRQRECEPGQPGCELKHTKVLRTVLTTDLESAHRYDQIFVANTSDVVPGSTAIGTSATVLRELKSRGETELSLCGDSSDAPLMDAEGKLHAIPGGCVNFSRPLTLKRVGNTPTPVRVLVNGVSMDLPAVHAKTAPGSGERDEFFFLDDERNPLTLAFRLGIGGIQANSPNLRKLCEGARNGVPFSLTGPVSCDLPEGGDVDTLRVVKITTRCDTSANNSASGGGAGGTPGGGAGGAVADLERTLSAGEPVDIYSIYFLFNSAALREESEPTLKDIAEVLRRHPDWKLQVNGHTDAIGGDTFNLELSQKRAAAVKDALVKRYKVSEVRLNTSGSGRSQPKDTNDTVEGRAHNRRVELRKIN